MTRLPPERVIEFLPQLDQLRRIVKADLLGLSLLSGKQDKAAAFEEALAEVKANDAQAIISEKSARALLTEIDEARRQSKSE
jgi:hyaluronoglucosaminidase